jgi:ABC-type lipoprotein release transport system permease subunit
MLVVLLVSANVATMFLARSSARDRELGVRRAIGASVARQARQLVTESVVLTGIGGALGVLASYWLIAVIRELGTRILPRMDAVALDGRVAVFAVLSTVVMGIVGGLAPALLSRRDSAIDASGARVTGTRTSSTLVIAQVTLSVVLAVGAGLLAKSFLGVVPTDPGFDPRNRATITVQLRGRDELTTP